jgi:hypothetical protein
MSLLKCPHCHLSIHPRASWLTLDYCPRCLAKRRVAEPVGMTDEPTVSGFAMLEKAASAGRVGSETSAMISMRSPSHRLGARDRNA